MELLDRYLQAVKKHLPWQRQDDIIAELKANLEAQLEDKESALGRPLTAEEMEAWLKRLGAPFQMAARYYPQQYLIGPAVFRMYWLVLKLALSWAIIIYLVVSGVSLIAGSPSVSAAVDALLRIPVILMSVAAWVTLVFAIIEFGVTHYPSKFKALTGDSFDWSSATITAVTDESGSWKKKRTYTLAVAEVIFGFLGLIWLLLVPKHLYLLMGPGAAYLNSLPFELSPAWVSVYWWVVALNVLQLGWRCVDLIRESWQGERLVQHLAVKILGLVPVVLFLSIPPQSYFTLKNPALDQVRYGSGLSALNQAIHWSVAVASVVIVLQLVWDFGRIGVNAYRKHAAAR
jgi:hypothetical protein